MANTGCKIVFIVGCVLLGLLVIWVISTIVQCLCMGSSVLKHAAVVVAEVKVTPLINNHHKHTLIQICIPMLNIIKDMLINLNLNLQCPLILVLVMIVKSEYGYNNHDGYEPVSNNNTNYQSPFNDRYKY